MRIVIKFVLSFISMIAVHIYLIFFWPGFHGLLWFLVPALLFISFVYDCYKLEMKRRERLKDVTDRTNAP